MVACPGSTSFANEWASLFKDYDDIYIVPDADEAGEKMVQKICGLIPRAKVVRLPEGDLSDFILEHGTTGVLEELFGAAQPAKVDAPLRRTSYHFSGDSSIDRSALVSFVLLDTRLVRRGKELVGLCPFHDEKTPSFMLDPKKNLFYCHGCGTGGDVIAYVKKRYNEGYGDAIRRIKRL